MPQVVEQVRESEERMTKAELFVVHVFFPKMVVGGESLTREQIETIEPRIGKNGTGNIITHLVKKTLPGGQRVQPILLESNDRPAKLTLNRVWTSRVSTLYEATTLVLNRIHMVSRAYEHNKSKKKATKVTQQKEVKVMKKKVRTMTPDLDQLCRARLAKQMAGRVRGISVARLARMIEATESWTLNRMRELVNTGLVSHLAGTRTWQSTSKVLNDFNRALDVPETGDSSKIKVPKPTRDDHEIVNLASGVDIVEMKALFLDEKVLTIPRLSETLLKRYGLTKFPWDA